MLSASILWAVLETEASCSWVWVSAYVQRAPPSAKRISGFLCKEEKKWKNGSINTFFPMRGAFPLPSGLGPVVVNNWFPNHKGFYRMQNHCQYDVHLNRFPQKRTPSSTPSRFHLRYTICPLHISDSGYLICPGESVCFYADTVNY